MNAQYPEQATACSTLTMLSLPAPQGGDLRLSAIENARPVTSFWALAIGSIGVVYGGIGTSPLYAFREAIVAYRRAISLVTLTFGYVETPNVPTALAIAATDYFQIPTGRVVEIGTQVAV